MSKTVAPEAVHIYKNDKILLRQPRITVTIMGNIPIRPIIHLRSTLESKDSQFKSTEWGTYFNWQADAYKRLQDSTIA